MGDDGNGWNEYQKLVLRELELHGERINLLNEEITRIRVDVAGLRVRASVWGMLAGMIPVLIAILLKALH